jgi:hypothetical protein
LPLTEKIERGPFHFTEKTLIFWFSGSAIFSLPLTEKIEIILEFESKICIKDLYQRFASKICIKDLFSVSELYPMLKESLDCASNLML